jgi:hypothetical protein
MLRWLYHLLFDSLPVRLPSDFDLSQSVSKLRDATSRWYSPSLFSQSVRGIVRADYISLSRAMPYFHNGFKPYLVGRFVETDDGQVALVGTFGLSWWAKGFMSFWFGFCILWTCGAAFAVMHQADGSYYMPLFGLGMFIAGIAFVAFAKSLSQTDIPWISAQITKALRSESDAT